MIQILLVVSAALRFCPSPDARSFDSSLVTAILPLHKEASINPDFLLPEASTDPAQAATHKQRDIIPYV